MSTDRSSPAGLPAPPFLRSAAEVAGDRAACAFLLRHRLLPVWARREEEGAALPEELAQAVRDERRKNAKRAMVLAENARPLLEALLAEGIRVVAYKGVVVAETLFASPSDRAMIDFDAWCPERAEDALRIALDLGWKVDPGYAIGETGRFGWSREVNLFSPKREISFDLHRELFPERRFAGVRARAASRLIPAPENLPRGVLRLEPGDEALVGAIHAGGHHGWESLLRHWEVGEALRRGGPQLVERLRHEATEGGCRRILELSLAIARHQLGIELPEPELDRRGRYWLRLVENALLRELRGAGFPGRLAELATVLLQQDRLSANVKYGISRVRRARD